ncbi:hypothetical protein CXB51_023496 [Gossypium anomalum]|uniref:Reverse transcriptase Ty1/copia-type domain-containing protein n=1 Tax=Gossypium anomalum TaxID=47600 RepID=A0A8J5YVV3_9ROSI|nr:hypothetical protein CXB51_023496 [Gossypium anomalum]
MVSEGIILMGNNASCKIAGVERIKVKKFDGVVRTLSDVRHVPKLKRNLISLSTLDSKGYRYTAKSGVLKISKGSLVVMKGQRKTAKLYVLHMSENGMVELRKRGLLDGQGICKLNFCKHCVFEKQKRVRFTRGIHNTKGTLEYIHSDLWGPSRVPSRGGANYMLTFIDDFLRKVWAFFLKQKSDIVQVRRDRETLDSSSYSTVKRRCRTNEQNDHGKEAASTACFLINRSPSVAIEKKTPQEVWSGNPANYSDLKIFGCPATGREIKPLKKYAEADLVTYALNVAEDIDANQELSNYSKVFKKKEGTLGVEEPRYKVRLVAKGYSQIPRADFIDVFSPVVKHSSIRALLGIVAMHDLELEQLDIKAAFLHGELEEDIYMQQPEGFTVSEKEDYVCLLKKSLYGLKQSPRQWYKRFDSFMTFHDFKRSSFDSCVYFKKNSDGSFVYLLLYVDNMLIAAKDKGEIRKVKAQLSEEFEMKYLGPAKKILGMEILRDRKVSKLYLSQKGYIEKVLCRFNMQSVKPVSTPLAAHFRLSSALFPQSDDEIEYMSHVPYSSAVGSLMYAMVCSRLDLSCAVSAVSRYMANPGKEHWKAVQWILRYLRGTTDVCLQFGRPEDGVIGYVDADFAGDLIEEDLPQVMSLQ